ncbi:hypothetical protein PDL71_01720 [Lacibacter sp. MH-610]|uniref:hypothetical protein n=1 Tax=Lacibacter sp. MH-610 TaxID=3020883 RepID=UPI003891F045
MNPGKTSGAFFMLAVFFRILYIFLYPPAGTDHQLIHAAVDNLLSGNGLSFTTANPNDLSSILYQPMNEWPPLVAYLVSIAKAITGSSAAADLFLMSMGMLLLLIILRSIFQLMQIGAKTQVLLWIIIAANPDPFAHLGISDLYSALFMLWGVLFSLRFLQMPYATKAQIFIASIFFFLPAAFRYQYYPLVFIFPLFLLFTGWWKQQKHLYQSGLLSLSVVFCLLSFQVAMLYQETGSAAYIADEKGFYPQNLQWAYPFLLKSFLNISYIENKLLLIGKWTLVPYYLSSFILSVVLLGYCFIRAIKKSKGGLWNFEEERSGLQVSKLFLLTVILSIITLLVFLSVLYSPQVNYGSVFTYLREDRYFIVCSLLLLIYFGKQLDGLPFIHLPSFTVLKRVTITSVVVVNLMLFGKFLFNAATDNLKDLHQISAIEKNIIETEIDILKKKYNLPVVAVSSIKLLQYNPSAGEYSVAKTLKQINNTGLRTSQPVQLILVTQPTLKEEEVFFVKSKGAKEVFKNGRLRIFHLIVPQQSSLASLY